MKIYFRLQPMFFSVPVFCRQGEYVKVNKAAYFKENKSLLLLM